MAPRSPRSLSPPAGSSPRVEVVAALLWTADGVLVQQRPENVAQPLAWEFPGGKVEPGEEATAALRRECREELGVEVAVGPLAFDLQHDYPEKIIRLRLFFAHLTGDVAPRPLAARALRWLPPARLQVAEFCAADAPIIEALRQGRIEPWVP